MADAVLGAIETLISNMNAFYVVVLLLTLGIIFIVISYMRNEYWWRGTFTFLFGLFIIIVEVFGISKGIITPKLVAPLVTVSILFMTVGVLLFMFGVMERIRRGVEDEYESEVDEYEEESD